MGSGCGSVGRVVSSDTRDHWLKFNIKQIVFIINWIESLLKRQNKKETGNGPFDLTITAKVLNWKLMCTISITFAFILSRVCCELFFLCSHYLPTYLPMENVISSIISNQTWNVSCWKKSFAFRPPTVWPDWAISGTLGNFSKPVAKIILPKLPTFFRQFLNRSQNLLFF